MALVRYQDLQNDLRTTEQQAARQTVELSDARRLLETLSAPNSARVTLTTPSDRQPTAEVVYQRNRGRLALVASNLAPLTPNHVYQLWLMPTSSQSPLPAGTFAPDERGHASLFMAMPPNLKPTGFEVTIEPAEGSVVPKTKAILSGQID